MNKIQNNKYTDNRHHHTAIEKYFQRRSALSYFLGRNQIVPIKKYSLFSRGYLSLRNFRRQHFQKFDDIVFRRMSIMTFYISIHCHFIATIFFEVIQQLRRIFSYFKEMIIKFHQKSCMQRRSRKRSHCYTHQIKIIHNRLF